MESWVIWEKVHMDIASEIEEAMKSPELCPEEQHSLQHEHSVRVTFADGRVHDMTLAKACKGIAGMRRFVVPVISAVHIRSGLVIYG